MDVAAFLDRVQHNPSYAGQLAHVEMLPERPGKYGAPAESLPPALTSMLAERGIERLYSHQVAALEDARAGRDFVVVTGTASGKTLCYHLPILEACLGDPEARAVPVSHQSARAGSAQESAGTLERSRSSSSEYGLRRAQSRKTRSAEWRTAKEQIGKFVRRRGNRDAGPGTPRRHHRRRLRRRHAHVAAAANQGRGEPGPLEPRHAARFDPALPSQIRPVLQRAAVRGARRSAHVSRHPRRSCRLRAAPIDPRVRALWLAAGVHRHQRHDRQPWRADCKAHWPAGGSN